jgi:hypothetical protein
LPCATPARLNCVASAEECANSAAQARDINRDFWMSAGEAQAYGVVDAILGATEATAAVDRAEATLTAAPEAPGLTAEREARRAGNQHAQHSARLGRASDRRRRVSWRYEAYRVTRLRRSSRSRHSRRLDTKPRAPPKTLGAEQVAEA